MNNKTLTILTSITLALVCVLLMLNITGGATKLSLPEQKDVIAVVGQGKISMKPDVAYITLGYENIDLDAKKALDDNSGKTKNIIDTLINAGIKQENIQTIQYRVNQENDYVNGEKILVGFRVVNMLYVNGSRC